MPKKKNVQNKTIKLKSFTSTVRIPKYGIKARYQNMINRFKAEQQKNITNF